jgi:hypothetical protein
MGGTHVIDPRDKAIASAIDILRARTDTPEGRDVVILSGGADSILIAARLAANAGKSVVHGLIVDGHPQMPTHQLKGQRETLRRFQAWVMAKKLPMVFTRLDLGARGSMGVVGVSPQAVVWLCAILPYVANGDRVHFGYIRHDDLWHVKADFEAAFRAMCAFKGVTATLVYDLEWDSKIEVVRGLRAAGVPPNCIWTCESPLLFRKKPAQCGTCGKCLALAEAIATMEREDANPPTVTRLSLDVPRRDDRKPAVFRWKPQPRFRLQKMQRTASAKRAKT